MLRRNVTGISMTCKLGISMSCKLGTSQKYLSEIPCLWFEETGRGVPWHAGSRPPSWSQSHFKTSQTSASCPTPVATLSDWDLLEFHPLFTVFTHDVKNFVASNPRWSTSAQNSPLFHRNEEQFEVLSEISTFQLSYPDRDLTVYCWGETQHSRTLHYIVLLFSRRNGLLPLRQKSLLVVQ